MKKIKVLLLSVLTAGVIQAQETKILPIFDADYCPAPTVALMGGYGKYAGASGSAAMYGVELGFACPVFQIKDLVINQVLSLVNSSKDGLDTTSLEMNPRIMFKVADKVEFGVGPGLGIIFADGTKSDTVIGLNLGASLQYDISSDIFVGLESRYQWAGDAELTPGVQTDLDNSRTMIKIGKRF